MQSALATIEARRESVAQATAATHKSKFGQFMTPGPIAGFMAGLFPALAGRDIRLLDAGAGVGSLTAAFACAATDQGAASVSATAWELDPAKPLKYPGRLWPFLPSARYSR
jgi:adenine-specific DNA-methyltransferase